MKAIIFFVVLSFQQTSTKQFKCTVANCCETKPFTYTIFTEKQPAVGDTIPIEIKKSI